MKLRTENLRSILYLISLVILLGGLGSAVLIYATAHDDWIGAQGYEVANGTVYPDNPEDSKQYLRGLQLYGGTANLLADQFRRWFAGLWHGKSLALTVACLTILLSSGFFYAANHLRD
ncbi:conserved exported hypothetical protein [Syntrophobacter sp. SbD1]|nr:conserved exported hypothetical protein [Syntrophobacter sp. SbD1]